MGEVIYRSNKVINMAAKAFECDSFRDMANEGWLMSLHMSAVIFIITLFVCVCAALKG